MLARIKALGGQIIFPSKEYGSIRASVPFEVAEKIAALIKSANASLTNAQVRTILTTTALDIEGAGYDIDSGFGIVQAYQAIQAVAPTPMSNIALGTNSVSEGSFSNGNGSVDPGELDKLLVQLVNPSMATATGATATLTTTTPGITITTATANYGNIVVASGTVTIGNSIIAGGALLS